MGIYVENYDKYIKPKLNFVADENQLTQYKIVINGSCFEHVRNIQQLDDVVKYVNEKGCLAIHTLVKGEIPKDPNWFI